MKKCNKCSGSEVKERTIASYEYDVLDLPFKIILENAVKEICCAQCEIRRKVLVPDHHGLESMVALKRILDSRKLSGREVRFLRKILGMTSKALAEEVGLSAETLSKIENSRVAISDAHERILRNSVWLERIWDAPGFKVSKAGAQALRRLKIRAATAVGTEVSYRFSIGPVPEERMNEHFKNCIHASEEFESYSADCEDAQKQQWQMNVTTTRKAS